MSAAHRVSVANLLDNRFDGDQMNVSLALDSKLADLVEPLAPHYNVFVANKPGAISRNITIPDPVIACISNWLRFET